MSQESRDPRGSKGVIFNGTDTDDDEDDDGEDDPASVSAFKSCSPLT